MVFIAMGSGLLLGLVIGVLLARVFWNTGALAVERARALEAENERSLSELRSELRRVSQENLDLNRKISAVEAIQPQVEANQARLEAERAKAQSAYELQQTVVSDLKARTATLDSEKKLLEQQLKAQREYLDEVRKQTRSEFENLANQVLEAKSKSFSEQTEKNLEGLLKPLKEKIVTFEKTVDEKYTHEAKERHALKSEIERLIGLNDRMTKETQSLTQALKGDNKVMGDWGELVLERILEASGLREGHEYTTQQSLLNEEGDRLRPDIIIHLPEGKHLIVDSKVSLKAYELYRGAQDEEARAQAVSAHLKSIEKHMSDLSDKHYAKLKGLNSPEFVFLFVPIEPAYLMAMQADPSLSTKAWNKNIAFVTTTTLLTSLKTVASTWRLENQNKNAQAIAAEGAKLYDKFVGFLEDFEKIGNAFDAGKRQYDSAMGKLREGPGNVFRKMELLRELGAAPNKRIKQELLE